MHNTAFILSLLLHRFRNMHVKTGFFPMPFCWFCNSVGTTGILVTANKYFKYLPMLISAYVQCFPKGKCQMNVVVRFSSVICFFSGWNIINNEVIYSDQHPFAWCQRINCIVLLNNNNSMNLRYSHSPVRITVPVFPGVFQLCQLHNSCWMTIFRRKICVGELLQYLFIHNVVIRIPRHLLECRISWRRISHIFICAHCRQNMRRKCRIRNVLNVVQVIDAIIQLADCNENICSRKLFTSKRLLSCQSTAISNELFCSWKKFLAKKEWASLQSPGVVALNEAISFTTKRKLLFEEYKTWKVFCNETILTAK